MKVAPSIYRAICLLNSSGNSSGSNIHSQINTLFIIDRAICLLKSNSDQSIRDITKIVASQAQDCTT